MIIYPVRRSLTPFVWFVVLLVGLYGATLFIFWRFAQPTLFDLQLLLIVLGFLQTALFVEKLDALTGTVEHLRMGRYHVRAEIEGDDELMRYADALTMLAAKLEAAERKERQLERMRRNLIAWIGYDLRVPLVVARAHLEKVVESPTSNPDTSERCLQIAWRNLNALSDLIDDLYDMAQLEVSGIHLERTEVSICSLVEATVAELSPLAAQKGVTFTYRCDPDAPRLLIDARQIGRVLNNLVSDAIQRTPKGGSIKLNIHPSKHNVLVEITDMANGSSSEDLKTLLNLLFDEDDARSLSGDTPRLRLAMADAIIRAHGSQIHPQRLGDQGLRLVFALARADVVNPLIRDM